MDKARSLISSKASKRTGLPVSPIKSQMTVSFQSGQWQDKALSNSWPKPWQPGKTTLPSQSHSGKTQLCTAPSKRAPWSHYAPPLNTRYRHRRPEPLAAHTLALSSTPRRPQRRRPAHLPRRRPRPPRPLGRRAPRSRAGQLALGRHARTYRRRSQHRQGED